jgi:hypothetical protein
MEIAAKQPSSVSPAGNPQLGTETGQRAPPVHDQQRERPVLSGRRCRAGAASWPIAWLFWTLASADQSALNLMMPFLVTH